MNIRNILIVLNICLTTAFSYSQKVEYYIDGDTMIHNRIKNLFYNSKNTIKDENLCKNSTYILKVSYLYPIFISSFNSVSINRYAKSKSTLFVLLLCDSAKNVREVYFDVTNFSISKKLVTSLHKAERKLLGYPIPFIEHQCTNEQFTKVIWPIEFNKL